MDDTIPSTVLTRIARHVATLRAWNEAIAQARHMEAIAHQPGRYEYDLRYTAAGDSIRHRVHVAAIALESLEMEATAHNVSQGALYAACGGKPTPLPEGESVRLWETDAEKRSRR